MLPSACTAVHVFELDISILDRVADFVASSPRSLGKLELAFGRCELQSSSQHSGRWLRVLGAELGLWSENTDELPLDAVKKALHWIGVSRPLEGGWYGLSTADLHAAAELFEGLQTPSGVCSLRGEGSARVHFDVRFGAEGSRALSSFFHNTVGTTITASSTVVACDIFGQSVTLGLQLCTRPRAVVNVEGLGPYMVLELNLDLEQIRLAPPDGLEECLVIRCTLQSGESRAESHSFLRKFDATDFVPELQEWHGLYKAEEIEHLLSFWPTAGGVCHVAELELYLSDRDPGPVWSGRSWDSWEDRPGRDVRSAVWNAWQRNTGLVPLVHVMSNELADKPFAAGALAGSIALLRRGGGLGFAQKAAAARDAGAVGCIIYDGEKALSMSPWGGDECMGLMFDGAELPDPGIPTVLVGQEVSRQLVAAAKSGNSFVRIGLDHSRESMLRMPQRFEVLVEAVRHARPIHVAVSFELISQALMTETLQRRRHPV